MADRALLTGINQYKYISHLRGCVNDVRMVERLLIEVFGFAAANIKTLIDSQVTKERITKEWARMLKDVKRGDRIVFHFSGHGSHIADKDGDEEDGADELLCLYDMDFDDDRTYLLVDDLRKLTEQVPDSGYLTVLLDSCHSGTATRMMLAPTAAREVRFTGPPPLVDLQASLARLERSSGSSRSLAGRDADEVVTRLLAPRSALDERNTVLARFVEPPPHVSAALRRGGIRKQVRAAMAEARQGERMNHVLLAGSEATQTSADAFIEGNYHGAFSFYLDRTVREEGRSIDHQKLIRRLRDALAAERFSQTPQLEPAETTGPLLLRALPDPDRVTGAPALSQTDVLKILLEIRDLLAGRADDRLVGSRATGRRAIVYVHGICRHDASFADPWWQALRPHLAAPLRQELERNRHPVVWSDLVTPERQRSIAADSRQAAAEHELATLLREVLEDRAVRETLTAVEPQASDCNPVATRAVQDRVLLDIPGLNCIDDFVKYLLDDSVRRAVQKRFLDVAGPLLRDGVELEVVSHSWGTVVAFEALRTLDGEQLAGRVRNWFTVGAALSIVTVQRRLVPADGRRPRHVSRWLNLDARGDIVGGPLANAFQVTQEFLNLDPTTCRTIWSLVEPTCAHSSYFHASNLAVNRGIFAAQIQGGG
ncbi:MAG: caspase family protein [Pirellulaceae bacterium]